MGFVGNGIPVTVARAGRQYEVRAMSDGAARTVVKALLSSAVPELKVRRIGRLVRVVPNSPRVGSMEALAGLLRDLDFVVELDSAVEPAEAFTDGREKEEAANRGSEDGEWQCCECGEVFEPDFGDGEVECPRCGSTDIDLPETYEGLFHKKPKSASAVADPDPADDLKPSPMLPSGLKWSMSWMLDPGECDPGTKATVYEAFADGVEWTALAGCRDGQWFAVVYRDSNKKAGEKGDTVDVLYSNADSLEDAEELLSGWLGKDVTGSGRRVGDEIFEFVDEPSDRRTRTERRAALRENPEPHAVRLAKALALDLRDKYDDLHTFGELGHIRVLDSAGVDDESDAGETFYGIKGAVAGVVWDDEDWTSDYEWDQYPNDSFEYVPAGDHAMAIVYRAWTLGA